LLHTPEKKQRATSVPTPSCTPEQKKALRTLHATESGQRGRTVTAATKARVVSALEQEIEPGSPCKLARMSYDATVKHVAAREHVSPQKIRLWHKLAASGGELANAPAQRITRADREHMLYSMLGPRLEVEQFIFKWIEDAGGGLVHVGVAAASGTEAAHGHRCAERDAASLAARHAD
jgi:hypothetical protein